MADTVSAPTVSAPTVTIDQAMLEQALRAWLEYFEYDLHKSTECSEDTGEDTYPEEAAAFFGHLRRIAGE